MGREGRAGQQVAGHQHGTSGRCRFCGRARWPRCRPWKVVRFSGIFHLYFGWALGVQGHGLGIRARAANKSHSSSAMAAASRSPPLPITPLRPQSWRPMRLMRVVGGLGPSAGCGGTAAREVGGVPAQLKDAASAAIRAAPGFGEGLAPLAPTAIVTPLRRRGRPRFYPG